LLRLWTAAAPCGTPAGPNDVAYSYDKFDRLKSSRGQTEPLGTTYSYDALDRRASKCAGSAATDCAGGSRTDFAYIGLTTATSSEKRGASATVTASDRSYDYDAQLNRLGTDWKTGTGAPQYRSYAIGPDGTVEGLEGTNGVVAADEKYKYDPYGADLTDNTQAPGTTPAPPPPTATTLNQNAQDNPFRYQGVYYDAAIKSYDMQAREYQPLVGRFTTPDRLESAPADYSLQANPLTQNRYAFAAANPINNIESDGHCSPDGPCQPLPGTAGATRANERRVAQRQQQRLQAQAQGYNWYYHSQEYKSGTGIVAPGAAVPPPSPTPPPGVSRADYRPNLCRSYGAPYAGCAAGMAPQGNQPFDFGHALNVLSDVVIGDPLHNPLDALALLPTPLKALRVLRIAEDAAKAGSAAERGAEDAGIVYRRLDLAGGKSYIGQSKSVARFEARQLEHARANPFARFEFEILGRASPVTQLDVLEEWFIWQGVARAI
jgi:RHS repeat-associated protein